MRKDMIIMTVIIAVVVGAVIFLVLVADQQGGVPISDTSKLARADSHMTGSISAKVTLVEFGDYQCPACSAASPAIKQILQIYAGNPNFNFVFRNFPLISIHPNAMIAAEAAEAAGAQGKYFQMHELLYENQSEWAESKKPLDIFVKYAQQLGLDVSRFKQEVQDNKYESFINSDARDGNSIGVNSTPTFYLNGQQSIGVPLVNGLKAKIDAELAK